MYTRILIPLDGSKTAENVLPYARFLAGAFKVPVELMAVIDIAEMAAHLAAEKAPHLDTMVEDGVRRSQEYLNRVAASFPGVTVNCTVEKGKAADAIVEKGEADKGALITMATHGRSGVNRWLLGSVAEKVLRSTTNPLLLVRAREQAKSEGEASFKSIILPLDGSEMAERALPAVAALAKQLGLGIVLFRAYHIPYSVYGDEDGYSAVNIDSLITEVRDEAQSYLETKTAELKKQGLEKVTCIAKEGFSGDEIIKLGRETPDGLVAMCSHGRSGIKRWVLGSVTETVVRHSEDPVLIVRAG
jgi:nucleotide-binding universal stress UspA family protein